ncbi:MAG TPA: hypothetical protein VNT51_02770 [Miltoncostaeaceae bacterium]|nr:hypothetical protein [Miltoncostaeaceae bacterium]
MSATPPQPEPVAEALARVAAAPQGLLGLGMPRCAACMLLPASLAELADARPELVVAMGEFAGPEDWAERERLLWPRGIHVSRNSVPALALLVDGEVVASRAGGGPAHRIESWIAPRLGPPARPVPEGPTPAEREALAALEGRIAHHRAVKGWRQAGLGPA